MTRRISLALLLVTALLSLNGCAIFREFAPSVKVQPVTSEEYIKLKRGDVLTSGKLSRAARETIRVAGLEEGVCAEPSPACIDTLSITGGIPTERRLAALSELWLQQAMALTPSGDAPTTDAQVDAWLETARHAYAYLFFSGRAPGERAFEDRQTQVRDYYNYAAQQAASGMFHRVQAEAGRQATTRLLLRMAGWTIHTDVSGIRMPEGVDMPKELIPASSLSFAGLRSTYRRDGFGAEMVAVMADDPVTAVEVAQEESTPRAAPDGDAARPPRRPRRKAYSEMPSPALTLLIRFAGDNLDDILGTREITVSIHDPYRDAAIELHGQHVPLAANFTAGYGLWLARSGFNKQSLRTLLGRERGIDRPHLYLMQPYDPERRIVLMIHGLASSPEAWVNVANEVLGDEELRQHFQIWQVYYPTNLPLLLNQSAIRGIFTETLRNFDPAGTAPASRDYVIIGHSMGGVLARLLVSSSGDKLWDWAMDSYEFDDARLERARPRLNRMLRFEPLPGAERVIFIAAPHRGTAVADHRLGRWISRLVRLPLTVLEGLDDALSTPARDADGRRNKAPPHVPNSIDNLSETDPFVRAAADLPISPKVRYHSIIAQRDPAVALEDSDDGLVPYRSAHLDGAVSEKIIVSEHSVQETAPAILEIRRILHEDLDEAGQTPAAPGQSSE